jgi:hypothetical protein
MVHVDVQPNGPDVARFLEHENCQNEMAKRVKDACSKERILARIRRSKPKAKKGKGDAKVNGKEKGES